MTSLQQQQQQQFHPQHPYHPKNVNKHKWFESDVDLFNVLYREGNEYLDASIIRGYLQTQNIPMLVESVCWVLDLCQRYNQTTTSILTHRDPTLIGNRFALYSVIEALAINHGHIETNSNYTAPLIALIFTYNPETLNFVGILRSRQNWTSLTFRQAMQNCLYNQYLNCLKHDLTYISGGMFTRMKVAFTFLNAFAKYVNPKLLKGNNNNIPEDDAEAKLSILPGVYQHMSHWITKYLSTIDVSLDEYIPATMLTQYTDYNNNNEGNNNNNISANTKQQTLLFNDNLLEIPIHVQSSVTEFSTFIVFSQLAGYGMDMNDFLKQIPQALLRYLTIAVQSYNFETFKYVVAVDMFMNAETGNDLQQQFEQGKLTQAQVMEEQKKQERDELYQQEIYNKTYNTNILPSDDDVVIDGQKIPPRLYNKKEHHIATYVPQDSMIGNIITESVVTQILQKYQYFEKIQKIIYKINYLQGNVNQDVIDCVEQEIADEREMQYQKQLQRQQQQNDLNTSSTGSVNGDNNDLLRSDVVLFDKAIAKKEEKQEEVKKKQQQVNKKKSAYTFDDEKQLYREFRIDILADEIWKQDPIDPYNPSTAEEELDIDEKIQLYKQQIITYYNMIQLIVRFHEGIFSLYRYDFATPTQLIALWMAAYCYGDDIILNRLKDLYNITLDTWNDYDNTAHIECITKNCPPELKTTLPIAYRRAITDPKFKQQNKTLIYDLFWNFSNYELKRPILFYLKLKKKTKIYDLSLPLNPLCIATNLYNVDLSFIQTLLDAGAPFIPHSKYGDQYNVILQLLISNFDQLELKTIKILDYLSNYCRDHTAEKMHMSIDEFFTYLVKLTHIPLNTHNDNMCAISNNNNDNNNNDSSFDLKLKFLFPKSQGFKRYLLRYYYNHILDRKTWNEKVLPSPDVIIKALSSLLQISEPTPITGILMNSPRYLQYEQDVLEVIKFFIPNTYVLKKVVKSSNFLTVLTIVIKNRFVNILKYFVETGGLIIDRQIIYLFSMQQCSFNDYNDWNIYIPTFRELVSTKWKGPQVVEKKLLSIILDEGDHNNNDDGNGDDNNNNDNDLIDITTQNMWQKCQNKLFPLLCKPDILNIAIKDEEIDDNGEEENNNKDESVTTTTTTTTEGDESNSNPLTTSTISNKSKTTILEKKPIKKYKLSEIKTTKDGKKYREVEVPYKDITMIDFITDRVNNDKTQFLLKQEQQEQDDDDDEDKDEKVIADPINNNITLTEDIYNVIKPILDYKKDYSIQNFDYIPERLPAQCPTFRNLQKFDLTSKQGLSQYIASSFLIDPKKEDVLGRVGIPKLSFDVLENTCIDNIDSYYATVKNKNEMEKVLSLFCLKELNICNYTILNYLYFTYYKYYITNIIPLEKQSSFLNMLFLLFSYCPEVEYALYMLTTCVDNVGFIANCGNWLLYKILLETFPTARAPFSLLGKQYIMSGSPHKTTSNMSIHLSNAMICEEILRYSIHTFNQYTIEHREELIHETNNNKNKKTSTTTSSQVETPKLPPNATAAARRAAAAKAQREREKRQKEEEEAAAQQETVEGVLTRMQEFRYTLKYHNNTTHYSIIPSLSSKNNTIDINHPNYIQYQEIQKNTAIVTTQTHITPLYQLTQYHYGLHNINNNNNTNKQYINQIYFDMLSVDRYFKNIFNNNDNNESSSNNNIIYGIYISHLTQRALIALACDMLYQYKLDPELTKDLLKHRDIRDWTKIETNRDEFLPSLLFFRRIFTYTKFIPQQFLFFFCHLVPTTDPQIYHDILELSTFFTQMGRDGLFNQDVMFIAQPIQYHIFPSSHTYKMGTKNGLSLLYEFNYEYAFNRVQDNVKLMNGEDPKQNQKNIKPGQNNEQQKPVEIKPIPELTIYNMANYYTMYYQQPNENNNENPSDNNKIQLYKFDLLPQYNNMINPHIFVDLAGSLLLNSQDNLMPPLDEEEEEQRQKQLNEQPITYSTVLPQYQALRTISQLWVRMCEQRRISLFGQHTAAPIYETIPIKYLTRDELLLNGDKQQCELLLPPSYYTQYQARLLNNNSNDNNALYQSDANGMLTSSSSSSPSNNNNYNDNHSTYNEEQTNTTTTGKDNKNGSSSGMMVAIGAVAALAVSALGAAVYFMNNNNNNTNLDFDNNTTNDDDTNKQHRRKGKKRH